MMNKNEAVQKLSRGALISTAHAEDLYDSFFEKPVVPQCVADWYEGHKDEFEINLYREVCRVEENYNCGGLTDFQEWLISGKTSPFSILVNMHQFGYEVGEEKEYVIELKETPQILLFDEKNEGYYFAVHRALFSRDSHTRKELEANGFGWVFDCPGVKVKEVE